MKRHKAEASGYHAGLLQTDYSGKENWELVEKKISQRSGLRSKKGTRKKKVKTPARGNILEVAEFWRCGRCMETNPRGCS